MWMILDLSAMNKTQSTKLITWNSPSKIMVAKTSSKIKAIKMIRLQGPLIKMINKLSGQIKKERGRGMKKIGKIENKSKRKSSKRFRLLKKILTLKPWSPYIVLNTYQMTTELSYCKNSFLLLLGVVMNWLKRKLKFVKSSASQIPSLHKMRNSLSSWKWMELMSMKSLKLRLKTQMSKDCKKDFLNLARRNISSPMVN